jgi:hypothetical protein
MNPTTQIIAQIIFQAKSLTESSYSLSTIPKITLSIQSTAISPYSITVANFCFFTIHHPHSLKDGLAVPARCFSDAHVVRKRDFGSFRACGRETLRGLATDAARFVLRFALDIARKMGIIKGKRGDLLSQARLSLKDFESEEMPVPL